MALPTNRGDREQQKFREDSEGNVRVLTDSLVGFYEYQNRK